MLTECIHGKVFKDEDLEIQNWVNFEQNQFLNCHFQIYSSHSFHQRTCEAWVTENLEVEYHFETLIMSEGGGGGI